MDIDRLIRKIILTNMTLRFGSLMDIDRLIPYEILDMIRLSFGSLMDIDRLILKPCICTP